MSSLFSWLGRLLLSALQWLPAGMRRDLAPRALEDHSISVSVRAPGHGQVELSLDRGWSVAEVRRRLADRLGSPPGAGGRGRVKIILAGQALADDVLVSDCDLGQRTVLHAVVVRVEKEEEEEDREKGKGGDTEGNPLNQTLRDFQSPAPQNSDGDAGGSRRRAHFFVYCSSQQCRGLRPGKLRVRCRGCGEGAITLSRDPQGWRDVLEPGRITGRCESGRCLQEQQQESEARFFFKCAEGHQGREEGEEAPPLDLVKPNVEQVSCLACLDDASDPVVSFNCGGGDGQQQQQQQQQHSLCVPCFADYCRSRLGERSFVLDPELGYTVGCPSGCENSLVRETRHFKLVGDRDYERYQRFAAEESVLQSGGVLCPQPGCGMGIMPGEGREEERRVVCKAAGSGGGGCGFVFCRRCLQGFHLGECHDTLGADEDGEAGSSRWRRHLLQGTSALDPSAVAIRLTTKPCPGCRAPTERSGGCMHMVCAKAACGLNWCWVCQARWTRECMAAHWFG